LSTLASSGRALWDCRVCNGTSDSVSVVWWTLCCLLFSQSILTLLALGCCCLHSVTVFRDDFGALNVTLIASRAYSTLSLVTRVRKVRKRAIPPIKTFKIMPSRFAFISTLKKSVMKN
jgi:hypothetical protein